MGLLQVVAGGQYGSEGKGAIAGFLASQVNPAGLLAVRVGGPNAGHTVYGRCPRECTEHDTVADLAIPDLYESSSSERLAALVKPHIQHPWRLRQIPVAAVTAPGSMLMLAAGSEIDRQVLAQECMDLTSAGYRIEGRLTISPQATVIEQVHKDVEQGADGYEAGLVHKIGSTGKGIGAARCHRVMREAKLAKDFTDLQPWIGDTDNLMDSFLRASDLTVQIEGTQGYGLGLHAGHYPYCTSGDCRAIDFLAQAGASPWLAHRLEIWVVFRTFPIRVAGNSGPMRGELTWDKVGQPPELTTVTQKVRRVGVWDTDLAVAAARGNGASRRSRVARAALTMADYIVPGARDVTSIDKLSHEDRMALSQLITDTEHETDMQVALVGTGPNSIIDLRDHHETDRDWVDRHGW